MTASRGDRVIAANVLGLQAYIAEAAAERHRNTYRRSTDPETRRRSTHEGRAAADRAAALRRVAADLSADPQPEGTR